MEMDRRSVTGSVMGSVRLSILGPSIGSVMWSVVVSDMVWHVVSHGVSHEVAHEVSRGHSLCANSKVQVSQHKGWGRDGAKKMNTVFLPQVEKYMKFFICI